MEMNEFLARLFEAAKAAGFERSEAYLVENESFRAMSNEQEITQYSSSHTRGLGFRGMLNGHMGYASTEAFDAEAVAQLVAGAKDSAELCEDTDEQFLYGGSEPDPAWNMVSEDAPAAEKLAFCLEMERVAKAYDPRIKQIGGTSVLSGMQTVRIVNTLGLDKQYTDGYCGGYLEPIATEGDSTVTGFGIAFDRCFAALDAKKIAETTAKETIDKLHAKPVASGTYRVVVSNLAMTDLLETFVSGFSAENAQKHLSVLEGKVGEVIASDQVTIIDDPLLATGFASRPFDGEGVPSAKHVIVDKGMFRTFLHNLKTANKDGVQTTGNAGRGSYGASVRVSPTNFFIEAGEKSLDELLGEMGEGLLITEVSGLHAGANAVSGDFSLLSSGFAVHEGKRGEPVEQITVGGNFFEMLKHVRAVGSDLRFPSGGIGAPSVDVDELTVAGKQAKE